MPDPLVVPGAPGVPGAETPGQPTELADALKALVDTVGRYEPPFFRGQRGEWDGAVCDRIATENACDEWSAYLIEWKQRPEDMGTVPVSGACERHALDVDRREVARICSHPASPAGRPVAHTEKGERR